MKKVALVAVAVAAVLGLAAPAAADGWSQYPPPGFPPPPATSLFRQNTPPMYRWQAPPPRRYRPPYRARYGYFPPVYGYGYDDDDDGRRHRRGKQRGTRVIIIR